MTIRHRLRWEVITPPAFFLALTGLVAFPWFRDAGYLFLLDFVWPPVLEPPDFRAANGFLPGLSWEWLWWLLSHPFPTAVVQRVAFALPLFLAGLTTSSLVAWLLRDHPPARRTLAALAAGTFASLNPFVVTRVFMGQQNLLLAYALTPWALLATIRFLNTPRLGTGLLAGVSAAVVLLTNAHHLVLLPLLLLPFTISLVRTIRHVPRAGTAFLVPPVAVLLATAITHRAFATTPFSPHPLGPAARALGAPWSSNLVLDALALTANWKENLLYLFPHEALPGFGILVSILLAVMAIGVFAARRASAPRRVVVPLLLASALGLFLAIGVAHPFTEPVSTWLYAHVPFWLGLRDSGKFLTILGLAEAVFLGLGAATLGERLSRLGRFSLFPPVAVLALAFLAVSPAREGFDRQIVPTEYPQSWYAWNRILGERSGEKPHSAEASHFAPPAGGASRDRPAGRPRMLFLPWHQYLAFAFTDDVTVANPAPRFFRHAEVIAGDNSEVGGFDGRPFISSESRRPLSQTIENLLATVRERSDFGSQLAAENVRYVALARDTEDADAYDFLGSQGDLRLIFESPELLVWQTGSRSDSAPE